MLPQIPLNERIFINMEYDIVPCTIKSSYDVYNVSNFMVKHQGTFPSVIQVKFSCKIIHFILITMKPNYKNLTYVLLL